VFYNDQRREREERREKREERGERREGGREGGKLNLTVSIDYEIVLMHLIQG
jgi:hypothetical protein